MRGFLSQIIKNKAASAVKDTLTDEFSAKQQQSIQSGLGQLLTDIKDLAKDPLKGFDPEKALGRLLETYRDEQSPRSIRKVEKAPLLKQTKGKKGSSSDSEDEMETSTSVSLRNALRTVQLVRNNDPEIVARDFLKAVSETHPHLQEALKKEGKQAFGRFVERLQETGVLDKSARSLQKTALGSNPVLKKSARSAVESINSSLLRDDPLTSSSLTSSSRGQGGSGRTLS